MSLKRITNPKVGCEGRLNCGLGILIRIIALPTNV
jgi:hypothetical protein